jgi:hypothetical protein
MHGAGAEEGEGTCSIGTSETGVLAVPFFLGGLTPAFLGLADFRTAEVGAACLAGAFAVGSAEGASSATLVFLLF